MDPLWLYAGFAGFILFMLALDLGVFHRDQHVIGMREALGWSGFWISLALIFNLALWQFPGFFFGHKPLPEGITLDQVGATKGLEFLAGYLVEKALSVDNLFVIALIFSAFAVPAAYQHRVLFYGILGAIVLRTIFIFAGVGLMNAFHWIIYVFGALLVLTGIKMAMAKGAPPADPAKHWFVRLVKRILPVTEHFDGQRFFTRIVRPGGKTVLAATPLFLALVLVEFTDLVFAVDSIPAILALTSDPFIVLTSNIFAILGLRSLYFALAGLLDRFHYLSYALAAILVFVGVKMLLVDWFKIPVGVSLGVIALTLLAGVVASLLRPQVAAPKPVGT
jgi:tellurite resistance protein TerC